MAALNAGAHVITEKPMSLNIQEADDIIELARKRDRLVAVDMHKRYDPDHLRVRDDIKNRIGEPLYGAAYLEEPLEVSTRTFKWVEQSDPFSYVGPHWVDLICHYYQTKPVSLTAVGQKKRLVVNAQTRPAKKSSASGLAGIPLPHVRQFLVKNGREVGARAGWRIRCQSPAKRCCNRTKRR